MHGRAGRSGGGDAGGDPALLLPEADRFCVACGGPVGRGRDGRPGRLQGTCPWCRRRFDLRPHLTPGTVLEGRRGHWRVEGPFVRGGHAWLHRVVGAAEAAGADEAAGAGAGGPGHGVAVRTRGPDGNEAGVLAVEEPAVLLALAHPGLVRALDATEGPDGSRHLVTAPVDGVAATGPLPGPDPGAAAAAVVLAAVPAVAYLHAAGLLHADLKPAHLLGTGGPGAGPVVVVDLGSVRRIGDRTSPVWGTDGFLAPEIVPGGAGPSPASDVWALGRTLAVLAGPAPDPAVRALVDAATAVAPAARPRLDALAAGLAARVAVRGDTAVR